MNPISKLFTSLGEVLGMALDDFSRALERFSAQESTARNALRDVRKLKNAPMCGDTLAKLKSTQPLD